MSETGMEFGIALGIAGLGSVVTAVYRGGIELPAGLSAATGAAARDTLAQADVVAAELPEALRAPLLDSARAAFTEGLNVAGMFGGGIVALLALAATVLLRHIPASAAE